MVEGKQSPFKQTNKQTIRDDPFFSEVDSFEKWTRS